MNVSSPEFFHVARKVSLVGDDWTGREARVEHWCIEANNHDGDHGDVGVTSSKPYYNRDSLQKGNLNPEQANFLGGRVFQRLGRL